MPQMATEWVGGHWATENKESHKAIEEVLERWDEKNTSRVI